MRIDHYHPGFDIKCGCRIPGVSTVRTCKEISVTILLAFLSIPYVEITAIHE